jgi:CMP-N-acetylneuraminic acid synthetase
MKETVLAIVPARGGSKGIPAKNVRPLAGRPLLAYVAEVARASAAIDRLVLTTDSPEIAALGQRVGIEVPFLRPPALARDETPMLPVVEHAVASLEASSGLRPDVIVLLQPTSPLRRPEHIVAALELMRQSGCDAVASVVEVPRHHSPDYVMRIEEGRLKPFLPRGGSIARRQDARPAYARDGTVYAVRRGALAATGSLYGRRCAALLIPARESITLDTPDDWEEAERRLRAVADGEARTAAPRATGLDLVDDPVPGARDGAAPGR